MGSERGELASTQDRENWNERVTERRDNHASPIILRRFINILLEAGVLAAPSEENGWSVRWPVSSTLTIAEQAEVDLNRAKTLAEYVKNPGAESVVPPAVFLTRHMGYDDDAATEALETAGREELPPSNDPDED